MTPTSFAEQVEKEAREYGFQKFKENDKTYINSQIEKAFIAGSKSKVVADKIAELEKQIIELKKENSLMDEITIEELKNNNSI